jgi:predicted phosphodiesterase
MKVLVIPDVHGISSWKEIVKDVMHMPDVHVIFLGDYVDNYTMEPWLIMENLNDIIEFKKKHPEKVTLLLGNHDYAYLWNKSATSGFNADMLPVYRSIIQESWKHFQVAWGFQGKEKYTLFTHAGLTNWWYKALEREINDPETVMNKILVDGAVVSWKEYPLHELLNFFIDNVTLLWKIGTIRWGTSPSGSILWADKRDLLKDNFTGIDQVVGHTSGRYVDIRNKDGDKLYFTDTHNEYYQTMSGFMLELK